MSALIHGQEVKEPTRPTVEKPAFTQSKYKNRWKGRKWVGRSLARDGCPPLEMEKNNTIQHLHQPTRPN